MKKRCHENYKPLTTRPNRLWVDVYYQLHIQKPRCFSLRQMRVARGNQNGASLPERFTVRARIAMFRVTSPTDINVPTRVLLAVETKSSSVFMVGTFE